MKTKLIWFNIKKNYKISILAVFLLIIYFGLAQNSKFKEDYFIKYAEAITYLKNNRWIYDSLCVYQCDPIFSIAISFPEIVRYNSIQNFIETSAIEVLYVQYGKAYANFSIGKFQIKPSFAEELEQDYTQLPKALPYFKSQFSSTDNIYNRIKRLKRITDEGWQVKYLYMFVEVMNEKYKNKKWASIEEKLAFYATAYNSGYNKSETLIIRELSKFRFYTSVLKSEKLYNYASISVEFYKTYKNALKSSNCNY